MKLFVLSSQQATKKAAKLALRTFALGITLFGATACHQGEDCYYPRNQNCSEKAAKVGGLTATLKVGKTFCGVGKWGNLWLEADSTVANIGIIGFCGTPPYDNTSNSTPEKPLRPEPLRWLQPYSVEKGINYIPKEGETVRIVYEVVQDSKAYTTPSQVVTCSAYSGRHIPVNILCIEPVHTK